MMRSLLFFLVLAGSTSLGASALGQTAPPADPTAPDEAVEDAASDAQATPPLRIDPILVTYSETDWPRIGGAADTIDEAQLEQLEYDDAHQIVESVPGVQTRTEDAYGLRVNIGIRGVTSDRSRKITLTEDGVLFGPAPYAAPAAYYFPLMTRMTGVELFTGPAVTLFGPNTIGGALDLRARSAPERGTVGMFDLAGGMDAYRKTHGYAGYGSERWGVLVEALYLGSEGFKDLDGGGDTGFDRGEGRAVLRWNSDPTDRIEHRLVLRGGMQAERSLETYLGLTDADARSTPDRRYASSALDRMQWQRWEARADYRLQIGEALRWTTTLYRHQLERAWGKVDGFLDPSAPALFDVLNDPDSPRNRGYVEVLRGEQDTTDADAIAWRRNGRSYYAMGAQSSVRWRHTEGRLHHDLEGGVRLHQDQVIRDHTERTLQMFDGEATLDDSLTRQSSDNDGRATALALWMLYDLHVGALRILPGVRAESIQTRYRDRLADAERSAHQVAVLPALGVEVEVVDTLTVAASARRGFSPATPSTEPVDPETSWNGELGVRWEPSEDTQVDATGFATRYQNLVGSCTASAGCGVADLDREFAGGRARIAGLELLGAHRIAVGRGTWLPVRATYTFTHARFQTAFESTFPLYGEVEAGDELPYVPAHQGSLALGVERWSWNLLAFASATGPMREVAGAGEGLRTDPSFHLDVAGRYQFAALRHGTLGAYLRADNVTGSRGIGSRRPFGARPDKPFSMVGGLRWAL